MAFPPIVSVRNTDIHRVLMFEILAQSTCQSETLKRLKTETKISNLILPQNSSKS